MKSSLSKLFSRKIVFSALAALAVGGLAMPTTVQAGFTDAEREANIDTIRYVYYFLRDELDFSPAAACGILANIDRESEFDPTCYSATSSGSTKSYGILQWTDNIDSNTFTHLKDWCSANGYDYTTLDAQLQYMKAEMFDSSLNDKCPKTYYYMHGEEVYTPKTDCKHQGVSYPISDDADGAWNAGFTWCHFYERPSAKETESETRGDLAANAYWSMLPELESKIQIKTCQLLLPQVTFDYTGSKIRPEVIVSDGSLILVEGRDYTLSYKNNKKIGTGTVTVTGCGEFYGSQSMEFEIRLGTAALTSISNTKSGVKLQWTGVAGASKYAVYRRDNASSSWSKCKLTDLSESKRSFVDKSAEAGKDYCYTVRAEGDSSSVYSYDNNGISITRLTTPRLDKLSMNKSGYFKVNWQAVEGAESYRIYRMINDTEWELAAKVTADTTSWTDKETANGTFYTYTVRAASASTGKSKVSAYDPAGRSYYYMPKQVIHKTASKEAGTLSLKWDENDCASGYQVNFSYHSDFSDSKIWVDNKSKSSSVTLHELAQGKKCYVRIRSYAKINDHYYYSKWSDISLQKIRS